MSSTKSANADGASKMRKYKHTSKAEFDTFSGDLRDNLKLHKDKLHTVLFSGELHRLVERRITKEAKAEAKEDELGTEATVALISTRLEEYLEESSSTAFSMLTMNIDNDDLKDMLRDKYHTSRRALHMSTSRSTGRQQVTPLGSTSR